ncbi:hypothetical protein GCM10025768_19910 [Microbacterium pseudoresistens]|uniref:Cell division protein FtsL n=1 Tax=Microbacterium pseudoresistens TaxID=640634 RepID=A0A7Y9EZ04_9MICO|nr:hypothetical protein [Microbacterium pseudoresistens]NYD55685.1 hypothetical protein [Microbacterium pseudoresistens]
MSIAAEPLILPVVDEPTRERRLRPVEAPVRRRRPRVAYAVLALAGAALIGAVQMGLSIATTQDSFVLSDLAQQNKELTWQAQAIEDDLAGVNSPQSLAVAATNLGLVVGGTANYLRLSDGAVIGAAGEPNWLSSVEPRGAGAVANALVSDTPTPAPGSATGDGVEPTQEGEPVVDPAVPPAADGLPTPSMQ